MAKAEVLCIGTELLLGDVLDTNSQFLARGLAHLGIDCFYRVVVGDNPERIMACVKEALSRADILITSGGLGPTADDLTTECLAKLFGAELSLDEETLAFIEGIFKRRNIPMPPTNRKQALRPSGAEKLPNNVGSAPGVIWRLNQANLEHAGIAPGERPKTILTFPGVPSELRGMWEATASAYLTKHYQEGTIWSTELKHIGIGESALAEKYSDLLESQNPTVAPYAGRWECRLRVAAKAENEEAARALAQPVVDEILSKSGLDCYGFDNDTLEAVVGKLLSERSLTLAVAESCTGGLVSERLTSVSGSSAYCKLNLVAYSNEAKCDVLKVPESVMTEHGAVSAQCALAMARGMRELSHCDLALAITGIAGPAGGTEEKPVGTVYISLVANGFECGRALGLGSHVRRSEVRWRSVNEALNMVRIYLLSPEDLKSTPS